MRRFTIMTKKNTYIIVAYPEVELIENNRIRICSPYKMNEKLIKALLDDTDVDAKVQTQKIHLTFGSLYCIKEFENIGNYLPRLNDAFVVLPR